MSSLDVSPLAEGIDELDARALAVRLGDVERTIRALEAVATTIVASGDRRELFREDGHTSVRGWLKASLRISDVDVGHRVRTAKLVTSFPRCGRELAAGRLGVGQVRELARVYANPRCGEQLGGVVNELVHLARAHPHETFVRAVRAWERLADADGAHRDQEHTHAGRSARIAEVGDATYLDLRVGTAQGALIREVFDRFTQAEFDAEWDELHGRLGDAACPGRLERTESQRRADAVVAIFEAAAAASPNAERPEPVVNIVIDQAVYESQLAAMVGEAREDLGVNRIVSGDVTHTRCRTSNGAPVDPADAVTASLVGWVRRVVLDADGVIIDLGRRARLFRGSARQAARLQAAIDGDGRCIWAGCRNRRCQIDHNTAWTANGRTDQRNAAPLCPRHNRWKTRGYRVWRDQNGAWHTYRPDGTEIAAA